MTATLHHLSHLLRRNAPAFRHGVSECSAPGCTNPARTGDPCWSCVRAELVRLYGECVAADACRAALVERERVRASGIYREVTP